MKKSILILLVSLMVSQIQTQWISNYWGNNTGDNQIQNSKGLAVATDHNGNCYVTGYTTNPGSGSDIILIKYNDQGDTLYSRVYSGTGNGEDRAFGIAVDELDNVYLTGQISTSSRGLDLVVLKYNNFGDLLWSKTYGATNQNFDDAGLAITLDHDNRPYVTGYCTDEDGSKKIVTIRYNQNGNRAWVNTEDGQGSMDSRGFGIAVDETDNIYVTGYITSSTGKDMIIIKYAQNGIEKWAQIKNGTANEDDVAFGIAVDDNNKIYVTGYTTVDSTQSITDVVLIKVNPNGTFSWTKTYNEGSGLSTDKAFGIIVDEQDRIFVTGETSNSAQGTNYLTLRYNTSGTKIWSSVYNGPGDGDDYANAVKNLNNNKIVVTGASWGTNDNFDYATLKINKNNGNVSTEYRYSFSGNSNDIAKDVVVSPDKSIYVTGYSEIVVDNNATSSAISTTMVKNSDREENSASTIAPEKFSLSQNYPNPFNPSTTIKFSIGENSHVNLVVYDMMGRTVDVIVNNELTSGEYSITYTNKNLSSGIYFYSLSAGSFKDVKKMTLVK
jgi:uncharacterized delta-60 repeat protein